MLVLERIRALGLLGSLLLIGCGPARPDAKTLEHELVEAVPMQSTPGQVLEYLSGQKIEHSKYVRNDVLGNSIHAIVRDRRKWEIVKTDCGIEFRFDNHDRLVAIDVRERYTGP